MRIEISEELGKVLEQIRKENEYMCQGKGQSDTVRFLARYYRQNKDAMKIVEEAFQNIEKMLEVCFVKALRESLLKILPTESEFRLTGQKKKDGREP